MPIEKQLPANVRIGEATLARLARTAPGRSVDEMVNNLLNRHDALAREANTDHLTGLGNRKKFDIDLHTSVGLEKRYDGVSGGKGTALLLLDANNLKPLNDHFGHAFGDALLAGLGKAIERGIREESGDTAYRIGGDEFAVILHNINEEGIQKAISRIRRLFPEAFREAVAGIPFHAENTGKNDMQAKVRKLMEEKEKYAQVAIGSSTISAHLNANDIESGLKSEADQRMYMDKAAMKARRD